jgi:uncharacterized membrane protein YhaH (DUF805 family)
MMGVLSVVYYWIINPSDTSDFFEVLLGQLYISVVFLLVVFQTLKRLGDFDRPWWHIFALLIPFWSFFELLNLFFTKGDEGSNRFGERTPQHSSTLRRNMWLLTTMTVVSSLLVIWLLYSL